MIDGADDLAIEMWNPLPSFEMVLDGLVVREMKPSHRGSAGSRALGDFTKT